MKGVNAVVVYESFLFLSNFNFVAAYMLFLLSFTLFPVHLEPEK